MNLVENMKNSDQPAFATASPPSMDHNSYLQEGLTKREYFAGIAFQGFLANDRVIKHTPEKEIIARWSVQYADALLAELEKETANQPQGAN